MTIRKTFDVDLTALEAEVRRLAADDPNRVVDCKYTFTTEDGAVEPLCIFGHALVALGVPVRDLVPWDDASFNAPGVANQITDVVPAIAPAVVGEDSWFSKVQEIQDADQPWGDAVRWADDKNDRWFDLDNDDEEE